MTIGRYLAAAALAAIALPAYRNSPGSSYSAAPFLLPMDSPSGGAGALHKPRRFKRSQRK